jgi:hypothetical protein
MPRFKTRSFITDFSATESLLRLEVEIPQNVSPLIKSAPRGTTLLSISDIRAQKQRFHVNQSTLKTLFFDDWKQGLDFAQAFPELNTESAGLGTLDITDTKARIESEAAGAANSISLVGLTIPLIQLTRWAPLVLLSTQLYFWLHLYELVRKIKPDADGWEVAWIGIYRTLPAFIVALFSACVLPAVAAVCLGVTFVTSHYYGRGVAVAGCSLIIVAGFLLSALTAARLFRLRANG